MNTRKSTFRLVAAALISAILGGVIAAVSVDKFRDKRENENQEVLTASSQLPAQYTAFSPVGEPLDFSLAAEKTVKSVVHVKVVYQSQEQFGGRNELFEHFFGVPPQQRRDNIPQGSGSGVIISADGYVVTNNHVINNASEIRVTLDDKTTLPAKLIGADRNTDIALLKIEQEDGKKFSALTFSNSDNLRLGQWVLAVGNPFNLTSTVTAGIVSAKARNLDIIEDNFRIESFIQTDAAVNPGNSGGALVNLQGDLVGINTAIASRSGQYEGYSFAVPSNIAKKVVEDLMQFGVVQRAILGVSYFDLNDDRAEAFARQEGVKNFDELKKLKGVYISGVIDNSAAKDAGLQSGDVLTVVNGREVTGTSIVAEEIGKLRPGDKVDLVIIREGKTKQITATLRNKAGNTNVVTPKDNALSSLGAEFKAVDQSVAKKLGISGGLQVTALTNGKLKGLGLKEGFIITSINQKPVRSEDDLKRIFQQVKKGGIFIEGIYPNGQEAYYAFGV